MNIVSPNNTNYENSFSSNNLNYYSSSSLSFGTTGINSLNLLVLNSTQLNSFFIFLKSYVSNFSNTQKNFWIIYSYGFPFSNNPKGSRMGNGNGNPSIWAFKISSGNYFIEVNNLSNGKLLLINSFFSSLLNSNLYIN